jgi:alpha-L-fucosidase
MGVLQIDGFAGKVAYAQLLNDASEVKFSEDQGSPTKTLTLQLPVLQPKAEVPVIELFLN